MQSLQESESYYAGPEGRKEYIDASMPRLYRIFKNMSLSGIEFRGPTLDIASGWGIMFPAFRSFMPNLLPYQIAEMRLTELSYDGDVISGCEFECDKDRLGFEDCTFGTILFLDCIEHLIVDPVWTLLECNRALALGGHLVISTPNAAATFRMLNILEGANPASESHIKPSSIYQRHNREWTLGEIVSVVKCCGFDCCSYSTNTEQLSESERELLGVADSLGLVRQPLDQFGPEIFVVARKIEHATLDSDLPQDRRWPEWLYTSVAAYRKRPTSFPIVVGDDYA